MEIYGQESHVDIQEDLQNLTVDQLVDFILTKGEQITSIESDMNLASVILEGCGTSIEEELQKRERQNATTKIIDA